jgi:hypothetical protein
MSRKIYNSDAEGAYWRYHNRPEVKKARLLNNKITQLRRYLRFHERRIEEISGQLYACHLEQEAQVREREELSHIHSGNGK